MGQRVSEVLQVTIKWVSGSVKGATRAQLFVVSCEVIPRLLKFLLGLMVVGTNGGASNEAWGLQQASILP